MRSLSFVVVVAACALTLSAEVAPQPVSGVANPLYLKGIVERPWWNDAWAHRLPIVVSEMNTNAVTACVIDAVVDLGAKTSVESVRVITPWETEVPCWAEATGDGKTRVLFRTDLRPAENKPFFIYYGNAKAKRPVMAEDVQVFESEKVLTVRNGLITLGFSKSSTLPEALTVFKINSSPVANEFQGLPNGTPSAAIRPLSTARWNKGVKDVPLANEIRVVCRNPLKAEVHVANALTEADYVLYAGSDRLEYAIRPKEKGWIDTLSTAWASGGGIGADDFIYPSLSGEVRTMRAAMDIMDDVAGREIKYPDFGAWCREGWYMIRDRRTETSVGQFFNGDGAESLGHTHWNGTRAEWMNLRMKQPGNGARQEIRGAAFGTRKGSALVAADWLAWSNPPRILVGQSEPRRAIPRPKTDLSHEGMFAYNFTSINERPQSGEPGAYPSGSADWTQNERDVLREHGANTACVSFGFRDLPITKETYDTAYWWERESPYSWWKHDPVAATNSQWAADAWKRENLKARLAALRADGIATYYWGKFIAATIKNAVYLDEKARAFDRRLATDIWRSGYDAVWCTMLNHEGMALVSDEEKKKFGGSAYWDWSREGKDLFFGRVDSLHDHVRKFRAELKKADPKALLLFWGCDLALAGCDIFTYELAGECDVMIEELMDCITGDNVRSKYGAAHMRAMFDNELVPTTTHFWQRSGGYRWRIGNCDMPFAYGVNGFTQESYLYSEIDREIIDCTADFYRYAQYTGLHRITDAMKPVKYYTVFRDTRAHRDDIYASRMISWNPTKCTHTDAQACTWAMGMSAQTDITVNRFFNLKGLSRYRVVLVPHDRKLTKEDARVLKQYVDQGGVCYVDGTENDLAKALAKKGTPVKGAENLKLVELKSGKGWFIYSPLELSLKMQTAAANSPLRKVLAERVGVPEPVTVEEKYAQAVDGFLKTDGSRYLFTTYSKAMPGEAGAVVRAKLNIPVKEGLWALDCKTGVRTPFKGEVAFYQGHVETANILIGDDAATRVPAHAVQISGAMRPVASYRPLPPAAANLAERKDTGDFKVPCVIVELMHPDKNGDPQYVSRAKHWQLKEVGFTQKNYDEVSFRKAIAQATVLHVRTTPERQEQPFTDAAKEIKDLLARGGTVLFDQCATGKAAQKLLAEVGVDDPTAKGWRSMAHHGDGSQSARWDGDPKHPLHCVPDIIEKQWTGNYLQNLGCFTGWNKKTQWAPFVVKAHPEWAMTVIQEKVCGKGKVVYSENERAFTDWYESVTYGDNLYSYMINMSVKEHTRKVSLLSGGPGEPLETPFK